MMEEQMVNIIIWGEVLFVSLVGVWVYWDHKREVDKRNKRLKAIGSKRQKIIQLNLFFGYGKYGIEDDSDQIS